MAKRTYYDIEHLIKKYPGCEYYFPYGEKSSGKTYSINRHCLKAYFERGHKFCYVRRTDIDIKSTACKSMFNDLAQKELKKLSGGKYTNIVYYRQGWYLVTPDGEKEKEPFCVAFALNAAQHTNGSSFPDIKNIFVDEVITRDAYLNGEIEKLEVLISNIVRDRGDVTIFLAGNTWNKYSPYFKYFNFDPTELEEGQTAKRNFKNAAGTESTIALERTKPAPEGKSSDKYFSANSSQSVNMITHGAWVADSYPKSQTRWTDSDVLQTFYIIFDGNYITGHIINTDGNPFLFFHKKKQPYIYNQDSDIVFSDKPNYRANYYQSITRPIDDISRFIARLFQTGKAFYADDDTGEILRNYIMYSINTTGISKLRL